MTFPEQSGPLRGRRIGILLESDFVEEEISFLRLRFAEEGAEVVLLTRLWGNDSLEFTGHEHQAPLTVSGDLEALDYTELAAYSALVVPSGMVADRLRYPEHVGTPAPAVELMTRAFRLPNLLKVFSCHGLLLMTAAPEVMQGRSVTCHNNLVGDVRNMGAVYVDQDVVTDGDLITGRTTDHIHLLARATIEALARSAQPQEAGHGG